MKATDRRVSGMPLSTGPELRREKLLEAALAVAVESGFGRLTMDAVAQRAGISKGGLLYHFQSKSRLIKALLSRYCVAKTDGDAALSGITHGIGAAAVALLVAAADDPALLDGFIACNEVDGEQPSPPSAGKRWAQFSTCLETHLANSKSHSS